MMLRLSLLILFLIFFLFSINLYPFNKPVKAVQISYIKVKNFKELEKEFVKIKKKGFNTVIFRVFNNKGDRIYPFIPKNKVKTQCGVYFRSRYVPCVYDCLKKVISLAHKHNLKLIAWMQTRYLDFQKMDRNRYVIRYDFKKGKFTQSRGLSFFNPANFKFILNVYLDLLKYPVDGILFQDDLHILIDEDFNKFALKKFYKKTKIKLTEKNVNRLFYGNAISRKKIFSGKYLKLWQKLKSHQIKKFINFITFNLKTKKDIKIFMNVSYEFLLNSNINQKWFGYKFSDLKNSLIDYFVVMLYQEQIKKELKITNKEFINILNLIINNTRDKKLNKFIFKIQTYNWYENRIIKHYIIQNLLTFLKRNNIKNIALFPYYKNLF